MKKASLYTFCTLLGMALFSSSNAGEEFFPVPDILRPNVAFWKMVYSEVSTKEGLLHDRNHLLIIYDKVETTSPSNVEKVRQRRKEINRSIRVINSEPEESWGAEERRIVALFEEHACRDALKGAAERIRFQRGQRDRFISGIERSGMYLDTIRAILKQHNVPRQLAYLPHVESSFETEAYSKVGAAGLWQFMRATGASFGMKIDYQVDERRDPIIATRAAARYLTNAYQTLGAWPVAITSYNHGVNGMRRAVSTTGTNDIAVIVQNYQSRTFGFASSNFYASFIAASELAEDYQTIFPNVTLMPRKEFTSVTLDEYIVLDGLIASLGITREEFRSFNPAIRPSVYRQSQSMLPRGFTIHVPALIPSQQLQLALASIPDSLRSAQAPRPQYHRVTTGENLDRIARRYGVSVRDIALANNITRLNRIYAGQVLRIPPTIPSSTITAGSVARVDPAPAVQTPPAKEKADDEVDEIITAREELPSDIPEGPEIVTAKAGVEIIAKDTVADPKVIQYMVKRGDNLTHIAERFGTTVQQLAEKNSIRSLNSVYVGQTLNIPVITALKTDLTSAETPVDTTDVAKQDLKKEVPDTLEEVAASVATPPPSPKDSTPAVSTSFDVTVYNLEASLAPSGNQATIKVSLNETIGHYADWLGTPTMRIRQLNNMGRGSEIRFNSSVKIPVDSPKALEKFTSARLEYHMAIEEDFFSRFKVVEKRKRAVKRGENVWDIIREGETSIPLWLLLKYNRTLDPSVLNVGVQLLVPVVEEMN